jgi:CRP/FNR family transcriptional regulator
MSAPQIETNNSRVACSNCSLYKLCLPTGIDGHDLEELDTIIKRPQAYKRGERLFESGARFHSIFAIRSGSIKSFVSENGSEQVTGFHLPGELLGLEAIHSNAYATTTQAMESTCLCEIPFNRLQSLGKRLPVLQQQLLAVLSREIQHDHEMVKILGRNSAEERLAALMVNFSERYKNRGFSSTEFNLSMSRNDIGSYLGLAVETVSRIFSRFQKKGLLEVQRRHISIVDLISLRAIASGAETLTNKK